MKKLFSEVETAKQAESARGKLKSFWSAETQLSQRILIRCLELLEEIAANSRKRRTRKATEWPAFLGKRMRAGLTSTQAAAEWSKHKKAAADRESDGY